MQLKNAINESLDVAIEIKNIRNEIFTLLIFSEYYEDVDKYQAIKYIEQGLTKLRENNQEKTELFTYFLKNASRVYASIGENKKSIEYCNKWIELYKNEENVDFADQIYYSKAVAERKLGNIKQAQIDIEEAIKIIENNRRNLKTQDLRTSFFSQHQIQYEFYIDLCIRLHELEPTNNHIVKAIQLVENSRARSLLELIQASNVDVKQGISPQLLEQETNLNFQLNNKLENQIKAIRTGEKPEVITNLKKEVNDLRVKLQSVEAEIKQQSPRFKALSQIESLTVKDIQQNVVDKDTTLLEYSLGTERSFLWKVTPTSIDYYVLPNREQLEKLARNYVKLLIYPVTEKPNESKTDTQLREQYNKDLLKAGMELSEAILGPAAAKLNTRRLIVVPDGILQYVPFSALPLPNNKTAGQANPLIIDFEVLNLPSASTMAILKSETATRQSNSNGLAIFADPVFELQDSRIAKRNDGKKEDLKLKEDLITKDNYSRSAFLSETERAGITFKRLPAARKEAMAIQSLAGKEVKLALDFDANLVEATKPELSNYRYLHFATHGFFNSAHPELSGLVLSLYDKAGNEQSGFFTLNQVYNLKLSAELVVLSACQSGLGKEIKGEGIVGLNRGFLYAGAKRVVYSLWNVSDESTAVLMERFYSGMIKEGKSPSTALRDAQLSLQKDKRWNAPYYWAAFQLQGLW